jgi:hypothetical protein
MFRRKCAGCGGCGLKRKLFCECDGGVQKGTFVVFGNQRRDAMCLKCKVRECPPDFGATFVEILEPEDLNCPQFFGRAVLAWFSDLEYA